MIPAYHVAYVVDASVAVKWFIKEREDDREAAFALRRRHIEGQSRMIVPELFLLEVPNAIKASKRATEDELSKVITALHDERGALRDLAPIDAEVDAIARLDALQLDVIDLPAP